VSNIKAPVCIDFETFYSKKLKYSLKTSIAETYCKSHLFDPYMIAVHDGTESWVGDPRKFCWEALEGRTVLAHNAYFESTVIKEMQERGWIPKVNFAGGNIICTANMTAYLCNRRSLDAAIEHLYKQKVDKSARADADNKHWATDFTDEQKKTMSEYALGDAFWGQKIFADYGDRWPTMERRLSALTINQGMRGVQINVDRLNEYIIQTHEMKQNTEQQIPWIKDAEDDDWDDFNTKPTSSKCIAEQCRRDGIPCPPVKSEDEEAYEAWEATYGPSRPWIKCLGAWRSINKLYKTFLTMKERLRPDGTMPFALLYFGAHTGRFAGTAKINFQNFRKFPVFCNEHGLMETDWRREFAAVEEFDETGKFPAWVRYAIDVRSLILPRPGKKMIVSDLSQIEPRVLMWLVKDQVMLDLVAKGVSVYEAHARASMGWTGGSLKKEDKVLYALAKARVLALGYGAGWEKFIAMAQTLCGLDITKDDPEWVTEYGLDGTPKQVSGWGQNSKRIVKDFRASNPGIAGDTGLWRSLDEAMKRSIGEDFVMTLPSGRKMTYERVRGERRIEPDPETKLPRSRTVYTVGVGHKRVTTYGGKLTENCLGGQTEILTQERGWIRLLALRPHDLVWDGVAWVRHGGLVNKGPQKVIRLHGVWATPDHRFLTDQGWRSAGELKNETSQHDRLANLKLDGSEVSRNQKWAGVLGVFLRLWERVRSGRQGPSEKAPSILFAPMPSILATGERLSQHPSAEPTPSLRRVAVNEGSMPQAQAYRFQKLWRARHPSLPRVAGVIPTVLERHGGVVSTGNGLGSDQQLTGVSPGQLPMGYPKGEHAQQANDGSHCGASGCGCRRRTVPVNSLLPNLQGLPEREPVGSTGRYQTVYDIVNCGPRHRFVVRGGPAQPPMIAHNCVQATARDVFGEQLVRMEDNGWGNLFSAHDEAILEVDNDVSARDVEHEMSKCPEWLAGCPIAAEAQEVPHYLK
jgi:hypothetical protein